MSFTAEGLGQSVVSVPESQIFVSQSCLFCVSCYEYNGDDDDNKDDANNKYAAADDDNDY